MCSIVHKKSGDPLPGGLDGVQNLLSPGGRAALSSTVPQECVSSLGTLYVHEPLSFADLPTLAVDSNVLRALGNQIEARDITPRLSSFLNSDSLAYRGMMLSPEEVAEVIHSGIKLSKVSAAGGGKINFGIVLDVPILAAFDIFGDAEQRGNALAVVVVLKQNEIPNPRLQYSLLETWDDVPSSALVCALVFDLKKSAFRELLIDRRKGEEVA